MSIFIDGRCGICGEVLPIGDAMLDESTSEVFVPPMNPAAVCGLISSPAHWACWAAVPDRLATIRKWGDRILEAAESSPFLQIVRDGMEALLLAQDDPSGCRLIVMPMAVGSWMDVSSSPWPPTWAAGLSHHRLMHEIERESLPRVIEELSGPFPTPEAAWRTVDWEPKRALERARQRDQIEKKQRRDELLDIHNEACDRLARLATSVGIACPHCRRFLKGDFRYLDNRPNGRSCIVCRRCGGSFGPEEAGVQAP